MFKNKIHILIPFHHTAVTTVLISNKALPFLIFSLLKLVMVLISIQGTVLHIVRTTIYYKFLLRLGVGDTDKPAICSLNFVCVALLTERPLQVSSK